MMRQTLTSLCGPHCGMFRSPTLAEKGQPAIVGHCPRCHSEAALLMSRRPQHGPKNGATDE